jgi:hypothetical protein
MMSVSRLKAPTMMSSAKMFRRGGFDRASGSHAVCIG